jgi:hypothetical protein
MGRRIAELSDHEKSEICRRYASGERLSRIAPDFGISEGLVSDVAKAAGIPPRQRRTGRAFEDCTFDIDKLKVEAIDDEARVVDTVLGSALGYERSRSIRQLIERLMPHLEKFGPSPHRVAMVAIGSGAQRETTEYLLNLGQVNYLITRCGLPRAEEWCVQIAKVFTAWQTGKLEAVDLDTAVELQDAAEAAAQATPELANLTHEIIQRIVEEAIAPLATEEQLIRVKDQLTRVEGIVSLFQKRKPPSPETQRQHIGTCLSFYNRKCACCETAIIINDDGKFCGQYDHATDNNSKNGAHETWPVCAECNRSFERRTKDRHDYRTQFDSYQIRRNLWRDSQQPSLPLPLPR